MRVVDSHTEGEPTRVVIEGGPPLGSGPLAVRRATFEHDFDDFRRAVILEPRGSDALVGALLVEPEDPGCATGAIFFNNAGYLGMCGHATIGVAVTLAHLGRIGPGHHRIETPVGIVDVHLVDANEARVGNVESFRHRAGIELDVDGLGTVRGDVAWGGNWFFLVDGAPFDLTLGNAAALTAVATRVRRALERDGITGADGAPIDHIELCGRALSPDAHGRNFVLCPGGVYDRSPCGTGTSAKLACLAADGRLAPDTPWIQESILGSRFEASYRPGARGGVLPTISGHAFVCGESTLIRHPLDPFRSGIA